MTLKEQTQTALANHAQSTGPHRLELEDSGDRLTAELLSIDKLACEFTHLTLRTGKLAEASAERLQAVATGLAQRLTYLLEPIAPIESDAETEAACAVPGNRRPLSSSARARSGRRRSRT